MAAYTFDSEYTWWMRLRLCVVFLREQEFSNLNEAPKSSLGLTVGIPGKISPARCASDNQSLFESSAIPVPSL